MTPGDLHRRLVLGGPRGLELEVNATDTLIQLRFGCQLDGTWLCADLALGSAPALTLRTSRAPRGVNAMWAMTRGVPVLPTTDVFVYALDWVQRRLVRLHRDDDARAALGDSAEARAQIARLVREAACVAVDRCDQGARTIAMRFKPHLRLRIVARIVGDPSGRLAELATSCPGALVFALALMEHQGAPASVASGERLLADVVAGRKLTAAIDDACVGWLDAVPACLRARRDPIEQHLVTVMGVAPAVAALQFLESERTWARALDPAARARVLADQRVLIRRAGPQVHTRALWLPPPLVLIPEDIPSQVRANARWFRTMQLHRVTRTHADRMAPVAQLRLVQFLSRNAVALARGPRPLQRAWIDDLLDTARATGRWPSRSSRLEHVQALVADWHARQPAVRGAGADRAAALLVPLAAPRFDHVMLDGLLGVQLAPIGDVGTLLAEGATMNHCVHTRHDAAMRGTALVFAGTVRGERVTVELVRVGDQWHLGDHRCRGNQLPSPPALEAIRVWGLVASSMQTAAEAQHVAAEALQLGQSAETMISL